MPEQRFISVDLARVFKTSNRGELLATLAYGDPVQVIQVTDEFIELNFAWFEEQPDGSQQPHTGSAFIVPTKTSGKKPADVLMAGDQNDVLKVDFVDVQQGDGAVVESPAGKVMLIDGGDNQLFARYLAGRYRGTSAAQPQEIDCILVTHGDADHFSGLTQIHLSETYMPESMAYKRLFIHPRRVYHNGLVKRPTKRNGHTLRDEEMFGATVQVGSDLIITGLEENLLAVPDEQMNKDFLAWKGALTAFRQRGPIEFRRIEQGDDDAFDFLADEDIKIRVYAPIPYDQDGVHGLRFLGSPPRGPRIGHESLDTTGDFKGKSASHTINGHSIIFHLTYGRVHFLFTGDLNDEAGRRLTLAHNDGEVSLRAEVLKVPHHGSADFSGAFLQAVSPVISIVSSGDENERKEYIHPRATLMGALGKYSRVDEPLIFVTELVAFFKTEGFTVPEFHKLVDGEVVIADGKAAQIKKPRGRFFAFSRTAFGTVKIRTNGRRLLVYTNSGQADLKEAYAYELNELGEPTPAEVVMV